MLLEKIRDGENKILEFKEKLPSNKIIAKTVIAFSNTSGGKLLIGVNDKREIVGLPEDINIFDLKDKLASIIYDNCYPMINPEIYTVNNFGKIIIVVEVFRGNLMPYYLKPEGKNNGVYIRLGATNRKAGIENIRELERLRQNVSFDEEINYEFEFKSLKIDAIKSEFEEMNKKLTNEKLENLKLIKIEKNIIYPTNGLLILLGKFENCNIKCSRFKGKTMEVFLDKKEYSGDIFQQIKSTEKFIKNYLKVESKINGLKREDVYEIPSQAIREALINAVVHRDYSNMGRDIKIGIYDDLLNIVSPGSFPNTITEEDILEGRSEIRNKVVARVFKELNYIEQWGSGINRMINSCIKKDLKKPSIKEKNDFVDVEIYRIITDKMPEEAEKMPDKVKEMPDENSFTKNEEKILLYLEEKNEITTAETVKILFLKERRAREILKRLTDKGVLVQCDKGRNTHYKKLLI
jgi:ATP-dependent DNA helicase RecG